MKRKVLAISGAQCSGKTTLFEALKSNSVFTDWTFYGSASSEVTKEKELANSQQATGEFAMAVADTYMTRHYSTDTNYVTDRCILDNAVYTDWTRIYDPQKLSLDADAYCEEVFATLIPTVSLICYCEPFPMVSNGGMRTTDEKFRQEIIRLFTKRLSVAGQLGVPIYRLPAYGVSHRVSLLLHTCFIHDLL